MTCWYRWVLAVCCPTHVWPGLYCRTFIAHTCVRRDALNPTPLPVCCSRVFLCVFTALCWCDWVGTEAHVWTLKSLRFALVVCSCVSYDFRNKQRIFPRAALSDSMRVLCWVRSEFQIFVALIFCSRGSRRQFWFPFFAITSKAPEGLSSCADKFWLVPARVKPEWPSPGPHKSDVRRSSESLK
jgi:hypothetical protein